MNSATRSLCAAEVLSLRERPRYFPRQLITPEEMTLEQDYFRRRLRLHNRMLHGWGVVCGALVCLSMDDNNRPKPWEVVVKPGYVLGPHGDEIVVDRERTVDLRHREQPAEREFDPWCKVPATKPTPDQPLYVAIKYKECLSRPVRVPPLGCGCDETQCEYSRWMDGYEIGLLDECPESHRGPAPDLDELFGGGVPPCPECPQDPWVVLARVEVGDGGRIKIIDNCSCRRMAVAFGAYWWRPGTRPAEGGMTIEEVILLDPTNTNALPTNNVGRNVTVVMIVNGNGLPDQPLLDLGTGIHVLAVEEAVANRIVAAIRIGADAALGPHDLRVVSPSCEVAEKEEVLRVVEVDEPPIPIPIGDVAPADVRPADVEKKPAAPKAKAAARKTTAPKTAARRARKSSPKEK